MTGRTNIGVFTADLSRYVRKIRAANNRTVSEAAQMLRDGIAAATPFGNPALWKRPAPPGYVPGTARRGWGIFINGTQVGVRGGQIRARATDSISIKNEPAKAYIDALNEGWSTQAPPGYIQAAVEQIRSRLRYSDPRKEAAA